MGVLCECGSRLEPCAGTEFRCNNKHCAHYAELRNLTFSLESSKESVNG
jgi:hypothetical protein